MNKSARRRQVARAFFNLMELEEEDPNKRQDWEKIKDSEREGMLWAAKNMIDLADALLPSLVSKHER